ASHLQVLARNRTYAKEQGFYELSRVFVPQGDGEQPIEPLRIGATIVSPENSYRIIKGYLDALARSSNVELMIEPVAAANGFAPSRAAEILLGGKVI
ncbi:hypothetical protein, partial [Enterococcus faecium]|uniref:hypothetical protein n=1 Tax=Enterococcus faecium TaxID=1352 RepID=UPI003F43601D